MSLNTNEKTVLVVDDDELNRTFLRRILVKQGYAVEEAENGQIALDKLVLMKPVLIIMDLRMPVMDGLEASKKIKENQTTKDIPILILSAHLDEDETYKHLLMLGLKNHHTKPIKI